MHVPCNPVASQRPARPPLAAAVVVLFASVVGVASAVEFDEKLKAPLAKDAAQLRLVARAASLEFAQVSGEDQETAIRNAATARKRFESRWAMTHAVEARAPLGDLSEFGLVPAADGSVRIDLRKYPQWDPFEDRLVGLLTHLQLDALGADLMKRGMRESDVAALRNYIGTNDAAAMSKSAALPVTLGFGRVVRKYDKIKRAVPNDLVVNYYYQREAATTESNRAWVAGLLDALEPQPRRVLLSYFNELGGFAVWTPGDTAAGIRATLASFRLPDFEQKARAEAAGGVK
jgi:hypothetical protein